MHLPKLNFKLLLIISIILLSIGIGLFIGFPKLLKKMIRGKVNVAPGSEIRPLYEKTPFFIHFRLRVFNITNKEEVIQGKKPKLHEVGPYFFEEWKEKFDLVDDDIEDTVTYHYRNKFIFRKDLSGPGLTGDEIVTMPHPLIMGMLLAANIDKKPMVPMLGGAIKAMFNDPTEAFFTGRVMDLLYDGVPVDCSSKEMAAIAVCTKLESEPAIRKVDDEHFAFSLFAGTNYTDLGEFKVFRGKKNSKDLGRVISFNGDTEMNTWDEDECNQYVGTDSTIFPSFMNVQDGIWAYEPSICRSLGATYRSKTKYNGIPVVRYEMDMGEKVNEKQCFCRSENECPPKGTIDLFKCSGMPMIASLPHFYKAEQLLEGIESGLNPNKEEHGIEMLFEIMTGTPFAASKRLQFSLQVKPIPEIEIMKNLPDATIPLFWVEESVKLGPEFTDKMKNSIFLMIKIVKIVKWLLIVVGLLGSILTGFALIMDRKNTTKVVMQNGGR